MNIMLGNLTVSEIEKRSGVEFPDELKQLMEETHQPEASNIADGKWHCYDIPFALVCGGMPLAQKIYNHLKAESSNFKEPLQIALA
jgi:hypothetical protein